MLFTEFTSKINQLKAENEKLASELSLYQGKAHAESLARHQAKEKSTRLEGKLSTTRVERGALHQKNILLSSTTEHLTKKMERSDREIKQAWSVLYKLGPDPYHCGVVT